MIESSHEDHVNAPAPGDLEDVRSFLSLHEHEEGRDASLPPTPSTLEGWLRRRDLLSPSTPIDPADLDWALSIRDALLTKVAENAGMPRDHAAVEVLNSAAQDTGLQLCFGCDENRLHTEVDGMRGVIGTILGTAFLADMDGSFHRLRECQDPTCPTVFYDRSKNHTAKWCSMASCGNRNKVRKFRERERASAAMDPAS
ncbi:MAG TPA: CGNR zinc finger domain-containing protein [Actinomycetota bacterium]